MITLRSIINLLKHYIETCHFDTGAPDCKTVLDQLYRVYQESHESDSVNIRNGFKELDTLLESIYQKDNNAVFNLCCGLSTAYEHQAFIDGLYYCAHLMMELNEI